MTHCTMNLNNFIFSEKRSDRVMRHVVFWLAWWFYFAILHAANPFGKPEIMYFRNIPFTFIESFLLLIPQFILSYSLLFFVLPHFALKRKYLLAILFTLIIWFICGVLTRYMAFNTNPAVLAAILPEKYLVNTQRPPPATFFMSFIANYKGALTISGFAIGLKFIKNWHLKAQHNLQLQKENTDAQLQLLTAQIHPHFLFNTLNNIFSQTQTESPKGSKMIMALSDILRYILYEGQKPLVPLKQELLMITEYIGLEKIRYGNKLDVHVLTPDVPDDLYIAPLLLLPFVENCFKHGTSNVIEAPWVNLTVEVNDKTLVVKLMNGKAPKKKSNLRKKGIGISNVRQRLELLYKHKYDLQVREDDEVFVIDLRVELIKIENKEQTGALVQKKSQSTYA